MNNDSAPTSETRTRRAIVKILKTDGPVTSADLANRLGVTAMAVRQHLYALQSEKLVKSEERPVPIGRPAKYWSLTVDADRLFPDAYAELSVSLISAVKDAFGNEGIETILKSRCSRQLEDYKLRIPEKASLKKKVEALAKVRTDEGYMAEVRNPAKGEYLLVENHCPICAAATACQGFCTTELDLFRSVLGPAVSVSREEHIVSGDRRCAYRIVERVEN